MANRDEIVFKKRLNKICGFHYSYQLEHRLVSKDAPVSQHSFEEKHQFMNKYLFSTLPRALFVIKYHEG